MNPGARDRIVLGLCPNCGKKGPHFVPPSMGDKGFFICDVKDGKPVRIERSHPERDKS